MGLHGGYPEGSGGGDVEGAGGGMAGIWRIRSTPTFDNIRGFAEASFDFTVPSKIF